MEFWYFLAGVLITLLVSILFYRLTRDRKKKIREKIEALDAHLEYVSKIKDSSDELFRKAFMWLFAILFLIAAGLFLPKIVAHFTGILGLPGLRFLFEPFSMLLFMAAALVAAMEYRVYSDVIHFEKAMERINNKKAALQQKYEDS